MSIYRKLAADSKKGIVTYSAVVISSPVIWGNPASRARIGQKFALAASNWWNISGFDVLANPDTEVRVVLSNHSAVAEYGWEENRLTLAS